jgi:hypothetical protein
MSEKARRFEEARKDDEMDPPPPEPIYDPTTGDKTELAKAATPRERNEMP